MDEAKQRTHIVSEEESGERLDVIAALAAGVTRSRAGALIHDGHVRVNAAVQTKAGYKLKAGDAVRPPARRRRISRWTFCIRTTIWPWSTSPRAWWCIRRRATRMARW